jgi:hypothetical protein
MTKPLARGRQRRRVVHGLALRCTLGKRLSLYRLVRFYHVTHGSSGPPRKGTCKRPRTNHVGACIAARIGRMRMARAVRPLPPAWLGRDGDRRVSRGVRSVSVTNQVSGPPVVQLARGRCRPTPASPLLSYLCGLGGRIWGVPRISTDNLSRQSNRRRAALELRSKLASFAMCSLADRLCARAWGAEAPSRAKGQQKQPRGFHRFARSHCESARLRFDSHACVAGPERVRRNRGAAIDRSEPFRGEAGLLQFHDCAENSSVG